MSQIVNQVITQPAGPGHVPPKKMGLKRYPFLFLIDRSGSTGGSNPDIDHINDAINELLTTLRMPGSSPLATQVDMIDVSIVMYDDKPIEILPWTIVQNLPASIPPLVPGGGTATGKALIFALDSIGARLRYYRDPANNISSGMPHIFHLTDGYMNDITPGTPEWTYVQDKIQNLDSNPTNLEKKKAATLINFISPKGMVNSADAGHLRVAQLSGASGVFDMKKEIGSFPQLVQMVTVIITSVTKAFSTKKALEEGVKATQTVAATKGVPPTQIAP